MVLLRYFRYFGIQVVLPTIKALTTNSQVFFELKRNDCIHPFKLRLPSTDVSTYKQIFIKQEYNFEVNSDPKVIIDAGANIGLASIYLINKYPNAKIFAIEPEISNFNLLKQNVSPYPNIVPIHAALWHTNEEISIIDPGLGKWGFMTESIFRSDSSSKATFQTAKGITVDSLMEEFKLDTIDILKIDIEGAEKEVFNDTSAWLGKVDSIIIELHEHMKSGCNRSFYCNSSGFNNEWLQGENVYLSRTNIICS